MPNSSLVSRNQSNDSKSVDQTETEQYRIYSRIQFSFVRAVQRQSTYRLDFVRRTACLCINVWPNMNGTYLIAGARIFNSRDQVIRNLPYGAAIEFSNIRDQATRKHPNGANTVLVQLRNLYIRLQVDFILQELEFSCLNFYNRKPKILITIKIDKLPFCFLQYPSARICVSGNLPPKSPRYIQ